MNRWPFVLVTATVAAFSGRAYAQTITHPVWATTPSAQDTTARAQFEAAVHKRGLGTPEVAAVSAPEARVAADLLAQGTAALHASNAVLASALLGEAATQAATTGAEGLTSRQLASIFFYQAVALQATSGAALTEPFTEIRPDEAKAAYLRAALVDPNLPVDDEPALAKASWRLAVAEIRQRPTTALTVGAPAHAMVSINAATAVPSPAKLSVPYGEHLIRVTEPGHVPWSTVVSTAQPNTLVDIAGTELAVYDPKAAAESSRGHGAAFALVGQLHLGSKVEVDLRLIDARTGELVDATAVPLAQGTDSAALDVAVLRLDELAARVNLRRRAEAAGAAADAPLALAAPPPRIPTAAPTTDAQPQNWFTQHWPVVTAVALAAGTTIVLSIVVAKDR